MSTSPRSPGGNPPQWTLLAPFAHPLTGPERHAPETGAKSLIEAISLIDTPAASRGACDDGQLGNVWLSSNDRLHDIG